MFSRQKGLCGAGGGAAHVEFILHNLVEVEGPASRDVRRASGGLQHPGGLQANDECAGECAWQEVSWSWSLNDKA